MDLKVIYQKLLAIAEKNGQEINENRLRQQAWVLRDRMMFEQSYSNNLSNSSSPGSGGGRISTSESILLNSILNTRTEVRYESIQLAVDEAENNDTLIVSPGVYSEGVIIDKSIEILGPNHNVYGTRNQEAVIKTTLDSGIISYTTSLSTTYKKNSFFINTGVNNVKISGFKFDGDLLFNDLDSNHVGGVAIGTGRISLNDNIEITNNIILNYQQKNINFDNTSNNSSSIWLQGVRSALIRDNYINSNSIGITILGPTFTNYFGTLPSDHIINISKNVIKSIYSGIYLRSLFGTITVDENNIEIIDRVPNNYGIYLRAFHSHNAPGVFRGSTLISKNSISSSNGVYSNVGNSTNIEIIENIIESGQTGVQVLRTYNQNQFLKINNNEINYIGHPWWAGWIGIYLSGNTASPSFYINPVEIKDNNLNGLHDSLDWYRFEDADTIAIRIEGTSNPGNTIITGNTITGWTVLNQMIYFRQSSQIAFNLETIKANNNMINSVIDGDDIKGA